jgi:hypothetical protein
MLGKLLSYMHQHKVILIQQTPLENRQAVKRVAGRVVPVDSRSAVISQRRVRCNPTNLLEAGSEFKITAQVSLGKTSQSKRGAGSPWPVRIQKLCKSAQTKDKNPHFRKLHSKRL